MVLRWMSRCLELRFLMYIYTCNIFIFIIQGLCIPTYPSIYSDEYSNVAAMPWCLVYTCHAKKHYANFPLGPPFASIYAFYLSRLNCLTGILSVGTPQNCVGNSICSSPVASQSSLATVLAIS